jgi:hypothetical protein
MRKLQRSLVKPGVPRKAPPGNTNRQQGEKGLRLWSPFLSPPHFLVLFAFFFAYPAAYHHFSVFQRAQVMGDDERQS